ncbi:MAG: DUF5915 domain-containing protein, partial [Myxococcota bacterium]|nr:DUF5915 domain-containing protein [Myxococcota bacterium]
ALESNRISQAVAAMEAFVDGLTNWYIRRSRRRFWKAQSDNDSDKHAAHWTLWEVLTTLSQLTAPFTPFLAERMHQQLVRPFDSQAAESVHLADWPQPGPVDQAVLNRMGAARRVANLGHAARQGAAVGVRQPLQKATLVSVDEGLLASLEDPQTQAVVREELNVRELEFAEDRAAYVTYEVKPNYRTLGRRLGKRMPLLARALAQLDPADVTARAQNDEAVTVSLEDGDSVDLSSEDLDIRIQQKEGTVSFFDEGLLVSLDTVLTENLLQEGLAREVINRIQNLRKDLDLAYDDRITLRWQGGRNIADALAVHGELVASEVLATRFLNEAHPEGQTELVRDEELTLHLEINGT